MDDLSAFGSRTLRRFEVSHHHGPADHTTARLETIRHIDLNVKLAKRLRCVKYGLVSDQESLWIDGVINDTEEALRGTTQRYEPAEVNKTNRQGLAFGGKAIWFFRGRHQLEDKHVRLIACHQSLTAAITYLFSKDAGSAPPLKVEKAKDKPPAYDPEIEQLFKWHNRHKRDRSSMSSKQSGFETNSNRTDVRSDISNCTAKDRDARSRLSLVGSDVQEEGITIGTSPVKGTVGGAPENLTSATTNADCLTSPRRHVHKNSSCSTEELWGRAEIDLPYSPPFVSRPRAMSLPDSQSYEQTQRPHSPYPMSPSDYPRGGPAEPKAQVHTSSPRTAHSGSCDNLVQRYAPNDQRDVVIPTTSNRSNPPKLITLYDLQMDLLKADDVDISYPGATGHCFEEADGLQLAEGTQPVSLPYQLPYLSISNISLCPSLSSLPETLRIGNQTLSNGLSGTYTSVKNRQVQPSAHAGTTSESAQNPPQPEPNCINLPTTNLVYTTESGGVSRPSRSGAKRGARSWLVFHTDRSNAHLPSS